MEGKGNNCYDLKGLGVFLTMVELPALRSHAKMVYLTNIVVIV